MTISRRREHLVDTAIGLFQKHGFHATGIDAILAAAGVSKKTLYHHFRSKDELILAALKKHEGVFRNDFMRRVEQRAQTPKGRLLAVFEVANDWFLSNKFYGCMFINAIGEHSGPDTPIRQVCREYKELMRNYIRGLCLEAGLQEPGEAAKKLALVLEGAIVTAQVSNPGEAGKTALETAKILIDQAR